MTDMDTSFVCFDLDHESVVETEEIESNDAICHNSSEYVYVSQKATVYILCT